eukprot:4692457-Pleurochrysis_carterae.AAC.2
MARANSSISAVGADAKLPTPSSSASVDAVCATKATHSRYLRTAQTISTPRPTSCCLKRTTGTFTTGAPDERTAASTKPEGAGGKGGGGCLVEQM